VFARVRLVWRQFFRGVGERMPKGLYARSAVIVILPMLLLQIVVSWVFMERHYQLVTRRLSEAVVRDIGSIISVIEVQSSFADSRCYQDIILYRDSPVIEFRMMVDWHEQHKALKLAFPAFQKVWV